MILALVIGLSGVMGMVSAEIWYRFRMRRLGRERRIAEFIEKQLWQFISLDEWLDQEVRDDR